MVFYPRRKYLISSKITYFSSKIGILSGLEQNFNEKVRKNEFFSKVFWARKDKVFTCISNRIISKRTGPYYFTPVPTRFLSRKSRGFIFLITLWPTYNFCRMDDFLLVIMIWSDTWLAESAILHLSVGADVGLCVGSTVSERFGVIFNRSDLY